MKIQLLITAELPLGDGVTTEFPTQLELVLHCATCADSLAPIRVHREERQSICLSGDHPFPAIIVEDLSNECSGPGQACYLIEYEYAPRFDELGNPLTSDFPAGCRLQVGSTCPRCEQTTQTWLETGHPSGEICECPCGYVLFWERSVNPKIRASETTAS